MGYKRLSYEIEWLFNSIKDNEVEFIKEFFTKEDYVEITNLKLSAESLWVSLFYDTSGDHKIERVGISLVYIWLDKVYRRKEEEKYWNSI